MNNYKLTYVVDEGMTDNAYVTERSEAAARRTLKGQIGSRDIVDIELIDTDVQATKEQELEAVRQIREIVGLMGPGSYIATALDGCLDDAENNIQDDAAYSMKQRYEGARQEAEALRDEIKSMEDGISELIQKDDERKAALEQMGRKVLSDELYTAIRNLAQEDHAAARRQMEESAETMAALAETPQDIAFATAVTGYREAKKRRALCESILTGLEDMYEESAKTPRPGRHPRGPLQA